MNLDSPELTPFVRDLIAHHGLQSFVETGTGYAKSLRWALSEDLDCWSCDVDQEQVENAREECPDAHVHLNESVAFLREVCPRVRGRALFWLDAHDPNKGEPVSAWPLADELAVIAELRDGRDIILIDDFMDPRFSFDVSLFPKHTAEIRYGVMVIEPDEVL